MILFFIISGPMLWCDISMFALAIVSSALISYIVYKTWKNIHDRIFCSVDIQCGQKSSENFGDAEHNFEYSSLGSFIENADEIEVCLEKEWKKRFKRALKAFNDCTESSPRSFFSLDTIIIQEPYPESPYIRIQTKRDITAGSTTEESFQNSPHGNVFMGIKNEYPLTPITWMVITVQ